jgi:hypothetical protein
LPDAAQTRPRRPVSSYVCHIGHKLTWPATVQAQLARIEFSLGAAMAHTKERAELCRLPATCAQCQVMPIVSTLYTNS